MSTYHSEEGTPVNQIMYEVYTTNILVHIVRDSGVCSHEVPRTFIRVWGPDNVYNISEADSVSIFRTIGPLNGHYLLRLLFYLKTEDGSVSETLQT